MYTLCLAQFSVQLDTTYKKCPRISCIAYLNLPRRLSTIVFDRHRNRDGRDQYFETIPSTRHLQKLTYGRVRDRDFFIIKIGMRPGWDRESCAFSLDTETRTSRDLNNFYRFSIFYVETGPKTSWKINKQMSPRTRLINNHNWSETETRPRVSVPLVLKLRWDRESYPSLHRKNAHCCGK